VIIFVVFKELEVLLLGQKTLKLLLILQFELHEPAVRLSSDRNVLGLVFKRGVDLGDGTLARHVYVGRSFDTLDCTLHSKS